MSVSVLVWAVTCPGAGSAASLFLVDELYTFTGEEAHLKEK